jgi:hypothetical protein
MFKHVLWFFTIADRNAARIWIKANFAVFTDEALILSTQYRFYTEDPLDEVQVKRLVDNLRIEEHFLNEGL